MDNFRIHNIPRKPFNYSRIDSTVSRSAQPQANELVCLAQHGVTDIVNFRIMVKPEIDFDEKALVERLGMRYHSIPSITSKPSQENVLNFLKLAKKVKERGGRLHMHCQLGADRTGMYSFIYEIMNNIHTTSSAGWEWLRRGHNHQKYPNLMQWACDFITKFKK